jgi:hypothetical protein
MRVEVDSSIPAHPANDKMIAYITGSMRFPVEATRCSGLVSGAKLWKADEVLPLLDC